MWFKVVIKRGFSINGLFNIINAGSIVAEHNSFFFFFFESRGDLEWILFVEGTVKFVSQFRLILARTRSAHKG